MKSFRGSSFFLGALLAMAACEDQSGPKDQTWTHEWRIENDTGDTLQVSARVVIWPHHPSITVPPGQVQILAHYSWFLGGPPDPKGHLDCLSAVSRNGVLLFQQHPVKDEGWQREDVQSFYALMTRRITDADLSPSGVPDSCGVLPNKPLQLTGAAREGP